MKAAHPEVVATTRVNPGETLRQVRESRSWSLPDVALRLNLTVTNQNTKKRPTNEQKHKIGRAHV